MVSVANLKELTNWSSFDLSNHLNFNLEDVICPICLDFPHNGVLLQCSSYDNGCRPFMCDTDHTLSNCLTRFKSAFGVIQAAECLITCEASTVSTLVTTAISERLPACPLCRGEVTGWIIIKEARACLNMKKRCCQENRCSYIGNFVELQHHVQLKHPHSHPSKIDPAQQSVWDNFQQSLDIIDVLSTIHAEVPHGVVLGDYVIEYSDDESGDGYDEFFHRGAKWWNPCMFYRVFGKLRCSGNRRRSRRGDLRQGRIRSSFDGSNEGSPSSVGTSAHRISEVEDEVPGMVGAERHAVASRGATNRHRYRSGGSISR